MGFSLRDVTRQFSAISSSVNANGVGVDIGTSSIKVVQVRRENSTVILESYGEMDLGRYDTPLRLRSGPSASGDGMTPERVAEALLDLMHEVKITSRTVGVSILSSSTLISIVEMPSRDQEQLDRLMPSEAQKYIPMKIEDVYLDWRIIPEISSRHSVFDAMNTGSSVAPTRQKIMLAAIYKQMVETYEKIIKHSNLSARFYEIEASSGARSALEKTVEPVLMIDLGAKTSKFYIVERDIVMVLHSVNVGGTDLTHAIVEGTQWDQARSEAAKRECGLAPDLPKSEAIGSKSQSFRAPSPSYKESKEIARVLTSTLETIVSEAQSLIDSYLRPFESSQDLRPFDATQDLRQKKDVARIVLIGGGARLPGIENYLKAKLQMPVEIARPFNRTQYPMVLEGNLNDAGPVFANAIGLALRAVETQ